MSKIKVLYAEDELALARIVSESLATRGFQIFNANNGHEAINLCKVHTPDICILDVMMPMMDGFTAGKNIRVSHPNLPIIFLTAKTQTKDVLEGFESGGNDYIRKPFSVEELIVRINNLLKIKGPSDESAKTTDSYAIGTYTFIPRKQELTRSDVSVTLSHRESKLLEVLCSHKNDTTFRKEILLSIWGDDSYFNSRTLDVYVNKLRKIFKKEEGVEIVTLKGVGYLFKVNS